MTSSQTPSARRRAQWQNRGSGFRSFSMPVRSLLLPKTEASSRERTPWARSRLAVDDVSRPKRKRTIMGRYVFGDELKPGERWKRRLGDAAKQVNQPAHLFRTMPKGRGPTK